MTQIFHDTHKACLRDGLDVAEIKACVVGFHERIIGTRKGAPVSC